MVTGRERERIELEKVLHLKNLVGQIYILVLHIITPTYNVRVKF